MKASEELVCGGILSRSENTRRNKGRSRLAWEEAIKSDLKECSISKKILYWIRVPKR
jgi:hypothetical protein